MLNYIGLKLINPQLVNIKTYIVEDEKKKGYKNINTVYYTKKKKISCTTGNKKKILYYS